MMGFHLTLLILEIVLCICILSIYAERCLKDVPEVNPKRYMRMEVYEKYKGLPIKFDVSRRVTHQITSTIAKIFLEEEMGYSDVEIEIHNDRFNETSEIRNRMRGGVGETDIPPETTVNAEVWISPEADSVSWFDEHRIKQCGPIGPPGRFGWFIPKSLLANKTVLPYWKTFTTSETSFFSLEDSVMQFVRSYSADQNGYICKESFCADGIYTPPVCEFQKCATLLAGFPDSTGFVVSHIERLGLRVRVVWLGSNLPMVVNRLTSNPTALSGGLVFLSFTPSVLVLPDDPTYVTVAFPPCEEFAQDTGCKYDLHSLMKLYSTILEKGAKPAYEAYLKMSFDQSEYRDLLLQYRNESARIGTGSKAVWHVACDWLKSNPFIRSYWKGNQKDKATLYIGGIFPLNPIRSGATYNDTPSIIKAAEMAKNAVNANNSVLRDYNLELLANDGRCEADFVLKAFIDHIRRDKYNQLVGILGPACSNTLEPIAGVSRHYRTIVISYSAEGSSFSNRAKYPYFFRTIGENNQYQQVYLQLLAKLNWKRLAALTEDGQKYTEYLTHLQDLLTAKNYTFVLNRKFPAVREKDAMRTYLEELKSKSVRIIIGDVYDDAAREMMCQAYRLDMTAREAYVWFLPGWLAKDWYDTDRYNRLTPQSQVPCNTKQMIEAINGHLSLTHAAWAPDDAIMETNISVKEWKQNLSAELNYTSPSPYAGYAYDAVWMYALALERLSQEDASAIPNIHLQDPTRKFVEILEKSDFNGVSGRIQFRGTASRTSVVQVLQWINKVNRIVGIFEPDMSNSTNNALSGTLFLNVSSIKWLNPEKTIPTDGTQKCYFGLAEYFGFNDCNVELTILNLIGFVFLSSLLVVAFFIIKRRYDKNMQLVDKIKKFPINLDLLPDSEPLEKWEIPRDKVVINRKLGEGGFGYVYGGEAQLPHLEGRWEAVAVKTLKVGSTPEEKLEFLCEAEVMKRFDHKNIVKLFGVCTKNEPVYTVMEFMLYGDLKNFLLARRHLVYEKGSGGDDSEVSSKRLTSMALDIARALSYLADQNFIHRDVACRNCLMNSAKVVKLGDFGMTRRMFDKDYYRFTRKGMLPVRWMSPEALAMGMFSPASDVWSFGVVLYEILTFGSFPFQGLSNNDVLEYVKKGNTLPIPAGAKPQAEGLIRSCWNLDYKKRPKASEITAFIAVNQRMLTPCLEMPLASVPPDDSGSMGLLQADRPRKYSFNLRHRNSSGSVFDSPVQHGGTSAMWAQEIMEMEDLQDLPPVREEIPEELNQPLLTTPDNYTLVHSPGLSTMDDSHL